MHLDPIGTILLLIFGFGWARPVPVNRFYFKNPRLAGIMTSIAGPLSNFLLTIIGGLILSLLSGVATGLVMGFIFNLFYWFTYLNILLFVFNLIPLPPLDGYRVVTDLVSNRVRAKLSQYEVYGTIIFLILVIVDPLFNITLRPILRLVPQIFYALLDLFNVFP